MNNFGKKKYQKLFNTIKKEIHDWDPYGLLAGDAPEDEFDSEISSLVSKVNRMKTKNDCIHLVSKVFSSSFERSKFDPEGCSEVGEKIFNSLMKKELIE